MNNKTTQDILKARFAQVLDHMRNRSGNIDLWTTLLFQPGATEFYFEQFLAGLSDSMKAILADDEEPSLAKMMGLGWDDGEFKQGVYGKLLVPIDGEPTALAALYMGSASALGGKSANEFGLRARKAHHLRACGTSIQIFDVLQRFLVKTHKVVFVTLWSIQLPSTYYRDPPCTKESRRLSVLFEAVLHGWLFTWDLGLRRQYGFTEGTSKTGYNLRQFQIWDTISLIGTNCRSPLFESLKDDEATSLAATRSPNELKKRKSTRHKELQEGRAIEDPDAVAKEKKTKLEKGNESRRQGKKLDMENGGIKAEAANQKRRDDYKAGEAERKAAALSKLEQNLPRTKEEEDKLAKDRTREKANYKKNPEPKKQRAKERDRKIRKEATPEELAKIREKNRIKMQKCRAKKAGTYVEE